MSRFDRRRFLKTAGSGVGALATASLSTSLAGARQPGATADIVVIGAGAFGGWTALYLREMGHAVTLIDQYGPGNSRATSGGETRQIRAVYGEREIHTTWALQAFDRWQAREAAGGKQLFFRTRPLSLGTARAQELSA